MSERAASPKPAPASAPLAILGVQTATLELASPAQVAMIDEVEVGRAVAHPFPLTVRVAFEVSDAAAAAALEERRRTGRGGRRVGRSR